PRAVNPGFPWLPATAAAIQFRAAAPLAGEKTTTVLPGSIPPRSGLGGLTLCLFFARIAIEKVAATYGTDPGWPMFACLARAAGPALTHSGARSPTRRGARGRSRRPGSSASRREAEERRRPPLHSGGRRIQCPAGQRLTGPPIEESTMS